MAGKERKRKRKANYLNFSCQIPMKDINTEQECRLKNNVKEQAERIELLLFSTGVYLNVLTQEVSGEMLLQHN